MFLNIHGLIIECIAQPLDLIDDLIKPFKYFKTDEALKASVKIYIKETIPPYSSFPTLKARFSTPRNIIYQDGASKIIDYFGKAVVVDKKNELILYSNERNYLKEIFYLLILSLFGQFCDKKNMLRIHALALSNNDRAFILMLPPGGGKSTMGFAMLQEKDICLISDDEAIFDKSGFILPFPLHIGTLNKNLIDSIPDEFVDVINRMEFGTKYLIDCDYFKDKIVKHRIKNITLFKGERILNRAPSIEKVSKIQIFNALFKNSVMAIGLYQGLEFICRSSSWEVLSKIPIIFKRLYLALKLTLLSEHYKFTLSTDISQNTECLRRFLKQYKPPYK